MLTTADWVVAFLPMLLSAAGVYFSHETKTRRKRIYRVALFAVVGLLLSLANLGQLYNNRRSAAETRDGLERQLNEVNSQLRELRQQNPVRQAASSLAGEILAFVAERDSYLNRSKLGQALTERESLDALAQASETVRIHRVKYAQRAVELIERIGHLTGKDVSGLEQKANGLRAAGQVQEIGNELAALASTLQ
jgi:hypothetical protein